MANLLVIYYSAFGHVFQMAQAVAEGASQSGAHQVRIVRIPEMIAVQNRVIQQDKVRSRAGDEQLASAATLSKQFRLTDRYSKYEATQALQQDIPIATNNDIRWTAIFGESRIFNRGCDWLLALWGIHFSGARQFAISGSKRASDGRSIRREGC